MRQLAKAENLLRLDAGRGSANLGVERPLMAYSVEKLASYLIGVRPGAKLLRASSDFSGYRARFLKAKAPVPIRSPGHSPLFAFSASATGPFASNSGQWQPAKTRPAHHLGHEVEVDLSAGCA